MTRFAACTLMFIKNLLRRIWKPTLEHGLIFTVAVLVVVSGLIISQLVSRRYSAGLMSTAVSRAENIAHKLALDASDKILIHDLVALQKLLDDQVASDPAVAYIFILKDERVLTHTFPDGVPVALIQANMPLDGEKGNLAKIASRENERFLDIAWPIFQNKAGVLRLGLSEDPYRRQVAALRFQMNVMTVIVLLAALLVSRIMIHRLLRPLTRLADAVDHIDENNLQARIQVSGRSEVNRLTTAFNHMLQRLGDFTERTRVYSKTLEQKNEELDRAGRQLQASFSVSQMVCALTNLKEICDYLLETLRQIVTCRNMALVVFGHENQVVFVARANELTTLDTSFHDRLHAVLPHGDEAGFLDKKVFKGMLPDFVDKAEVLMACAIHYNGQILGALLIACPGDCRCLKNQFEVIRLMLQQTAGAVHRARIHEAQVRDLRSRIGQDAVYADIVGKDPKMQAIYSLIDDVAPTDATVLIQGESGTGKEMVARAIHRRSQRSHKPFVVINCSAYPATLLESELFGHEKGAFTGALRRKAGRFEQADGGTVFLDEIGDISPGAQIKLLRILQSRQFERVGGEQVLEADVRVLAATHRNLAQAVESGSFREDLFYRLNVIPIHLPPLRERRNDIPLLAEHFLAKLIKTTSGRTIEGFSSDAMRKLLSYAWPGNVRELENSIEHAVVLAKVNRIEAADLPAAVLQKSAVALDPAVSRQTIEHSEEKLIRKVLEQCGWNKTDAAGTLGISRSTLYEKIKKYGIGKATLQ